MSTASASSGLRPYRGVVVGFATLLAVLLLAGSMTATAKANGITEGYLPGNPEATFPTVKDPETGEPCGEITWPEVSGGCVIESTHGPFQYTPTAGCSGYLEIHNLHVNSEGNFAAEDVSTDCYHYGAEPCDVEPEDSLYYHPEEKQAKEVLHSDPWTGTFVEVDGEHYAYLAICLTVTLAGPDAHWVDHIIAKVVSEDEEGSRGWEFVTSASDGWTEGEGFEAWLQQGPGAVVEWN